MSRYVKPLKVCNTEGRRITAIIRSGIQKININIPYLKEVENDNPLFSKKGVIRYVCERKDYQQAIVRLTQYLEDLFLKEIVNEHSNPIIKKSGINKGGDSKQNTSGEIKSDKRKWSTPSLHDSAGGKKLSESSGGGDTNTEMDESSSTPAKG